MSDINERNVDIFGVMMTIAEIAEMTGTPEATISQRISDGLNVLNGKKPSPPVRPQGGQQ